MNTWLERLICYAAAIGFFYFAYRLIKRNRDKWLVGSSLLLAFLSFLCSLSWFQGVFKTHIISVVYSTLEQYGKKLDEFQATTGKMQSTLTDQQSQVDKQQRELIAQQEVIRQAQEKLDTVQAGIIKQQKQIEDVEFLVSNLYSKVVFETIAATDTNRVFKQQLTNVWRIFIILKYAPITRSVQASMSGDLFPVPLQNPIPNEKNVTFQYFAPDWDFANVNFNFQYVRDTRETNTVKQVEFRGQNVFFDGHRAKLIEIKDEP